MDKNDLILVPYPKEIGFKQGTFILKNSCLILIPRQNGRQLFPVAKRLKNLVTDKTRLDLAITIIKGRQPLDEIAFMKEEDLQNEGYTLAVDTGGITIQYGGYPGAFHAVSTLKQLLHQYGKELPYLKISDCPDFRRRGIMLDISRDKIPSMETLFNLIDFMADMKLNQLQLYVEGFSFAYSTYHGIWQDGTPVTGEEIMEIESYCRDRFIELVPNQNSFGHMEAWLSRKEFEELAECPGSYDDEGGHFGKTASLNPLHPDSVNFIDSLYNDMLPYFNSDVLNVGCDETFELGEGRSREECLKAGTGRIYLNFLLKIYELVKNHGKKMMFWGDIIVKYPELINELPKDVIALEWGYEADHPYEEEGRKFKDAGIPFYVCPGTSSWNALTGRAENMKGNLLNAAVNGKRNGAVGYLITDWGDHGHWQYLPFSYAGFAYGSALCWNTEGNRDMDIAGFLDRFIFEDSSSIMGRMVMELGNYYLEENKHLSNITVIVVILYSELYDFSAIEGLDYDFFEATARFADKCLKEAEKAQMHCKDAELIDAEFRNAVNFIKYGAKLGELKKRISEKDDRYLIKALLEEIMDENTLLMMKHRELWLKRNRMGGLEDSLYLLEKFKRQYRDLISKLV